MTDADLLPFVGRRIRFKQHGVPFRYVGLVQRYGLRGQFVRVFVESYEHGDSLREYSFRATPRTISAWELIP